MKSTASVVLTKPGLKEIADVIRSGRMTYGKVDVRAMN